MAFPPNWKFKPELIRMGQRFGIVRGDRSQTEYSKWLDVPGNWVGAMEIRGFPTFFHFLARFREKEGRENLLLVLEDHRHISVVRGSRTPEEFATWLDSVDAQTISRYERSGFTSGVEHLKKFLEKEGIEAVEYVLCGEEVASISVSSEPQTVPRKQIFFSRAKWRG